MQQPQQGLQQTQQVVLLTTKAVYATAAVAVAVDATAAAIADATAAECCKAWAACLLARAEVVRPCSGCFEGAAIFQPNLHKAARAYTIEEKCSGSHRGSVYQALPPPKLTTKQRLPLE